MNHRKLSLEELQGLIEVGGGGYTMGHIIGGILSYKAHPELWDWIFESMEEQAGFLLPRGSADQLSASLKEYLGE